MRPSLTERAALVALLRLDEPGVPAWAERLEAGTTARFLLDQALSEPHGRPTLLPGDPAPLIARAVADLERWAAAGYDMTTVIDGRYPPNLRQVHDRPVLFFTRGEIRAEDQRAVAVIGSRKASEFGRRTARAVARALASSGYTVVSGMAAGIDSAAHEAALGSGGRTIAVVGSGLAYCYPPENRALESRIAARGAVLSQFWPETPPSRATFPVRNGVMSGIALATVVIEASPRSGARVQCRLALAHGRPVVLLDSLLEQPWARELAERPGVHVAGDSQQVPALVDQLASTETLTE